MTVRADLPCIEVSSLAKTFRGPQAAVPVLQGVNLRILPGEFVALLGPSGGGKSTLLNVIAGLDTGDAGWVRVAGDTKSRGRHIAYMQQKDLLLPWRTLWDNVLLAPELRSPADRAAAEDEAQTLLAKYQLGDFAHALPSTLSGGMRQRAALIRTLLCHKDVLLLDEPFGALDAITRGKLQAHVLEVWRTYGKTIVLVTHDVDEALALATRIVLLSAAPGRVVTELPLEIPHADRARSPAIADLKADILARLEGGHG